MGLDTAAAAASHGFQRRNVLCFLPCCRESEDELARPLSLFRALGKSTPPTLDFKLFILLDGQGDAENDNDTFKALQRILGSIATSVVLAGRDRGCRTYSLNVWSIPVVLYVKGDDLRRGKRYSQLLFAELAAAEARPVPWAYLCLDADVRTSVADVHRLIAALEADPAAGGVTGRLAVDNATGGPWNPVVEHQRFLYLHSACMQKMVDAASGITTVLCGAFCIVRHEVFQKCMPEYALIPDSDDVAAVNELDIGEDRFLTTLMIRHGHPTAFVPTAIAGTVVPATLAGYVNQQRRWVKSTMANDLHLVGALGAFEAAAGTDAQKTWRLVQWLILCVRYLEFVFGLGLGMAVLAQIVTGLIPAVGSPMTVVCVVFCYLSATAVACCARPDASKWGWLLHGHVGLLCALLTLSFASFFAARADSLAAERAGAVALGSAFAAAACNLGALHLVLMLSYVLTPVALQVPVREWGAHAWYAAQWIAFDGLYRLVLPIYAFSTLDNYAWGTRGVNHKQASHVADSSKPSYMLQGGRMRPFVRARSAAATKAGLLALYLGANAALAWGLLASHTILITRTVSVYKAIETTYSLISCARFAFMLAATYKNFLREKCALPSLWAAAKAAEFQPVPFQGILVDCHSGAGGEAKWTLLPQAPAQQVAPAAR